MYHNDQIVIYQYIHINQSVQGLTIEKEGDDMDHVGIFFKLYTYIIISPIINDI